MLFRYVNDEDEIGKEIEVKRHGVWVKAEIVEIVDDTSQQTTVQWILVLLLALEIIPKSKFGGFGVKKPVFRYCL